MILLPQIFKNMFTLNIVVFNVSLCTIRVIRVLRVGFNFVRGIRAPSFLAISIIKINKITLEIKIKSWVIVIITQLHRLLCEVELFCKFSRHAVFPASSLSIWNTNDAALLMNMFTHDEILCKHIPFTGSKEKWGCLLHWSPKFYNIVFFFVN